MYIIYSTLLALAAMAALPYFIVQGLRHGKYLGTVRARLGKLSAGARGRQGCMWLHAVSVGELLACQPLVAALRLRFPGRPLLVSTITETGYLTAIERIGKGVLAADAAFYCPFDFAFAVRRVLQQLRPAVLIVAETEFWPNLFREAHRAGVPVAVVNARVSDRSFPRYRLFRFFFRNVLNRARVLLPQSEEDARRLRAMGAEPARVRCAGNLKYDTRGPLPLAPWLEREIGRWVAPGALLAGSTAAGEEQFVLDAFRRARELRPRLRLIIAPRRPERFEEVARTCVATGYSVERRSELRPGRPIADRTDVLVIDTVGELAAFYAHATIAFVGGSLVPHGGQNVLEAAHFARPIIVGPFVHNFRDIVADFRRAGALRQVNEGDDLPSAVVQILGDMAGARRMGEAARAMLESNRGATERVVAELAKLLPPETVAGVPAAGRAPAEQRAPAERAQ